MATVMVSVSTAVRAHLRRLVASTVFTIAAVPVLAQQQGATQNVPTPPPYPYPYPYPYGHMMWGGPGGGGWHPGFAIAGSIFAVLAIIGIMAIFVWLVRWAVQGFPFYRHGFHHFLHGRSTALDILEERFAKGEIDKAEFEDKRRTIGR